MNLNYKTSVLIEVGRKYKLLAIPNEPHSRNYRTPSPIKLAENSSGSGAQK